MKSIETYKCLDCGNGWGLSYATWENQTCNNCGEYLNVTETTDDTKRESIGGLKMTEEKGKKSALTVQVSLTDTELFKDFFSLSLWMFRRLPKIHQEFAYKEIEEILDGQFDLREFEKLKKH